MTLHSRQGSHTRDRLSSGQVARHTPNGGDRYGERPGSVSAWKIQAHAFLCLQAEGSPNPVILNQTRQHHVDSGNCQATVFNSHQRAEVVQNP